MARSVGTPQQTAGDYDPREGTVSVTPKDGPETIRAEVEIDGAWHAVTLVRVAAEGDAERHWRIEAPGEPFDGWLLADSDLRRAVS